MCNPRRIRVKATRLLNEAWQREVSRQVELREQVIGEARVRQPLDATLGGATLRALEAALAAEGSGWVEVEEGYRFQVEGGYVLYLVEDRTLEIVAVLQDEVQASAEASQQLAGTLTTEIEAEGEGTYYDDEWAYLRPKEAGEREAQEKAQQGLEEMAHSQLEQAGLEAENAAASAVEAEARQKATERLKREAAERQAALAEQARQHLETVGLRARQAFHLVLARAYRDAILAYARQQGASNIQCEENGDVVDIQFSFTG